METILRSREGMNSIETTIYYSYLDTPIGRLLLVGNKASLMSIGFPEGKMSRRHLPGWVCNDNAFTAVAKQLNAYFSGNLRQFDVPLALQGSDFQLRVWNALRKIPFGETRSYSDVANDIGCPKAVRAVGAANAKNPVPIVVPCHRVIGKNGELVGFGGGLSIKQQLLALEKSNTQDHLTYAGT